MSPSTTKRTNNKRNIFISLFLVLAIVITGAFAYLTATDSKTNTFTVGNVKIDLTEPNWNPDYDSDGDGIKDTMSNILSGETVPKDPTITNTGSNDAYVYIMVEVPKGFAIDIKNSDGTTSAKEHYPLFSFEANDGWSLLDSQVGTDSDAYDYYLYAYNTALSSDSSATLFDKIKFADVASNVSSNIITQKTLDDLNVNITGYAIQSAFYGEEATNAAEAWALYVNQNNWKWPDKPYNGLLHVTFVDNNNNVLNEITTIEDTPTALYYDTSLAKTGYSFSWINEKTGEKAYTNMTFDEDTTLTATYKSTGFGTTPSNFFVYLLGMDENNKPSLSVVGADVSNSTYPSSNFANVIIPASINFTMPSVSGTGLKAMMTSSGCVIFPADIKLTAGETISVPVETIEAEALHCYYSFNSTSSDPKVDIYINNLVIPDSVKTIKNSAFGGSSSTVSGTVTIKNLHMSYGVETIEAAAFANQYYLENVTLPDSLTTIGDGAFGITVFEPSTGIKNLYLPDSVKEIGVEAFTNQASLASVSIPENTTEIKYGTFSGCESLNNVDFHNDITLIGEQAFAYTDLSSVNIGANVATIEDYAFESCESLVSINVNEQNTSYSDINGVLFNKDKSVLIQYPVNKAGTSYVVPDTVKTIQNRAFYGANNLASVEIGKNIKTLGSQAFTNCSSLENITFADGCALDTIEDSTFQYCTALKSVELPEGVHTIKSSAFYGCTGLKTVSTSNKLKLVEYGAFNKCTSLTNVYFDGTESEFQTIVIKNNNTPFISAEIHTN